MHDPRIDNLRRIIVKLEDRLACVEKALGILTKEEATELATLADLAADVAAETTVIGGAETLLDGLSAKIAALGTPTTDPATQAQIDALVLEVTTDKTSLAASVAKNTPSVTPAPAPDTTATPGA